MPGERQPGEGEIVHAAELLRAGKLVAFPTETVYGLGANALDAAAVARIFEVKGRPASSPIIVHVSNTQMARSVVAEWPADRAVARAEVLARTADSGAEEAAFGSYRRHSGSRYRRRADAVASGSAGIDRSGTTTYRRAKRQPLYPTLADHCRACSPGPR